MPNESGIQKPIEAKDFLGFVEWLKSKKTKDTMLCYCVILIAGAMALPIPYLVAIAAVGGIELGARGLIDMKKEANKNGNKPK